MRARIPTTVKLKFDEQEREILRRATYYNPEAGASVEESSRVDADDLATARGRALQGTNGVAGYNDYLVQEIRALRDAVAYAIEDGECDEDEYAEWSDLYDALDAAEDAWSRLDQHNSATKAEIDTELPL